MRALESASPASCKAPATFIDSIRPNNQPEESKESRNEIQLSANRIVLPCLGGWSQWLWLVSCRRQGMLTQGPAPDPKCKLNITSFLTLPHLLHCLICAKDIMIIVFLPQVMGDGKVRGGSFMLGFG